MPKHASPEVSTASPRKIGVALSGRPWPLLFIASSAAVALWSGWVGLGAMCGFGPVNLLPGIGGGLHVNTAITLPVGIEAYAAYALYVWLASAGASEDTRKFARRSAIGALALGCAGQVSYHLLAAFRITRPSVLAVVLVSCVPVMTLFFAAALVHMMHADARKAREREQAEAGRKAALAAARAERGTGTVTRKRKPAGTRKRKPATELPPPPAGSPPAELQPGEEAEEAVPLSPRERILELVAGGMSASAAGVAAGKTDSYGRQVWREHMRETRGEATG
jgi:hypothetical protein